LSILTNVGMCHRILLKFEIRNSSKPFWRQSPVSRGPTERWTWQG